MSRIRRAFHALTIPAALMLAGLRAAASPQDLPAAGYEIESIILVGNATLTTDELRRQMETRETAGWFGKFLYNSISENLGGTTEYYSAATLVQDIERLRLYYVDRGFSDVTIDTLLSYAGDPPSITIRLNIQEGYRSIIDSMMITGLEAAPGDVWAEIGASPEAKQGDPFQVARVEAEVRRIVRILNDHGYANCSFVKDSSYARRYTSTRNYDVRLAFDMGRSYTFGPIVVRQEVDSVRGMAARPDIDEELILDHLDFRPGDRFSLQKKMTSEANLNRLGLFELRNFGLGVPPRTDTSTAVSSFVTLRPLDKHEVAPDLFVSDEDGAFNLGTSIQYTNRNFIGGGTRLISRARFRTQTLWMFPSFFDNDSRSVANLDLTVELATPYVFSNRNTGSLSISYVIDKQIPYIQDILRSKVGVTLRSGRHTVNFIDWTLESVSLRVNSNFSATSEDPEVQRALRLLQEQQLNSILSFTVQRDMSNDVFSPSSGMVLSFTAEEAGIVPLVLEQLFSKNPYTQFYRLILYGRWYTDVTDKRFAVLATKARVGWEDKYGASRSDTNRVIPQTHRFFAGGGGSVRGWGSRDLIARGDPQLGGNMLAEMSVELRTNVFQSFRDDIFDKLWLLTFLDVGNVWLLPGQFQLKTVAIAAGIGLRYDTAFGPFRIDWGFRMYNPDAPEGERWVTQRKLFGQTIKEGVFHFGIGHAF